MKDKEYIVKDVEGGLIEEEEIIRCKYCQSWKENECNLPEYGWCGTLQMLTHEGDHCAWSPNLDDEENNETD